MMKTFKIWTYKEGDIPLMHDGPMSYIYSSEGHFIEEMERKGNPLAANHPDEAHAFFIPISVTRIVQYLFSPDDDPFGFMGRLQAIGPFVSRKNPKLFENLIRVLCNANSSEGFIPRRDVSMTEINGPYNNTPIVSGGQSPHNRSILAFFAGGNHGIVRKKLFQHWGNKEDNNIQVYTYLHKNQNYIEVLSQSKYCLCPSGYEVASDRLTEAIYVGCIPVIIKNNYVLPYSDVLDWSQFSVQVPVAKIPDLKRILQDIPFSKYLEMQKRVIEVQKHFTVNIPAERFDVFHMILHSVWLRRLNIRLLKS
ncbi:hypothetical protein L2E82_03266 [Cichorium intybus]|uniref:Uncharacterized protein n=1 Tax=Cichorium intybus TaxID=13427 RepID=A0ACB9H4M8_CICIN|nr:hypothetical protein L2E82_03266 [Cichorium intybus]